MSVLGITVCGMSDMSLCGIAVGDHVTFELAAVKLVMPVSGVEILHCGITVFGIR